jgi:hypothetical protein
MRTVSSLLAGGLPALQEALQHKLQTKNGLFGVSHCTATGSAAASYTVWITDTSYSATAARPAEK